MLSVQADGELVNTKTCALHGNEKALAILVYHSFIPYLIYSYPTETVKVTILPSEIPSQTSMRKSVGPHSNSSVQGTSEVCCILHATEVQDSASASVKRK